MAGPKAQFSLWTTPAKIKTSYKFLIFILLLISYLVAAPWLLGRLGEVSRIFVFVFALPAAFFWGLKGGVFVALAAPILVLINHTILGVPFTGGLVGPLFLLLINSIVGHMCDLSLQLEKELDRKDGAELELQRHKTNLEEMIRERTAALSQANAELQQEITERRHVANALHESEEKYRLLVENATEAIFIAQDGRLKFPNPKTLELIGYDKEEISGTSFVTFIHPDDREMVANMHQRRLAGDPTIPPSYAFRVIHKNGEEHTVELSAVKIDWEKRPATLNFIRDITDRKRAEVALRQSEERYRSLVENTLDGFFIAETPSGRFLFLNQRICQMFRYDMEQALALTIWDVIDSKEHSLARERMQARIEGREPGFTSNTYTAIRKDGSVFRAEISSSLIVYRDKPVLQGILRDVTQTEHLELQLQQAQKFEAIGTLAGGIAHDFNNLLMGIQGHLSLLSWELDSSHPQREHIDAIEDHIKSATHLTKQLLGFARGGKYEVKPLEINKLVGSSATMFGRTRKQIGIHTKLHPEDLVVEADKQQIDQMLLNIFINAWQAMPGGGDLYIETSEVRFGDEDWAPRGIHPGQYAKISVTDTGVGMDEKTRRRIFDPFFTTKDKSRGTGLGMASAYGIIKNHGGTITVYSEVGSGTTFNIYLPVSDGEVQAEKPLKEEVVRGSETLLLVDDEKIIIDVGQAMLEKLGYHVIVAESGAQAVEIVHRQGHRIGLIILDMIMPEMDGSKTFNRIREIRPAMPVILSSGYSINGKAAEILHRGCNGFIQKPFNIAELSKKIRDILDSKKGSSEG